MGVATRFLVAAAVLAVAGCGGGEGDQGGAPGGPSTQLAIEIRPEGPGGPVAFHTLRCDPSGGSFPDPEAACRRLAETGEEVFAPVPDDAACTEQYGGPEVARVSGSVDGKQVSTQFTRTNGCHIERWDRASFLLPEDDGT